MKRTVNIILKYTKDELIQKLHDAITTSENVSIASMEFDGKTFSFKCEEGVNTIPTGAQLSVLNFDNILCGEKPKEGKVKRFAGISKAIEKVLANGAIAPEDKILEELRVLHGFPELSASYLRNHLIVNKTKYYEKDSKVWTLLTK